MCDFKLYFPQSVRLKKHFFWRGENSKGHSYWVFLNFGLKGAQKWKIVLILGIMRATWYKEGTYHKPPTMLSLNVKENPAKAKTAQKNRPVPVSDSPSQSWRQGKT